MADLLPDELWSKILENGVQNPNSNTHLTYKDLCCISLSSHRFHRLSNDLSLWSSLLSLDFSSRLSNPTNNPIDYISPKLLYQTWYEKDKAKRIAAEKRAIMRVESRVFEGCRRVEELMRRCVDEGDKIKVVVDELNGLRKVRQASVALNVWQPEVIRGRQKQLVEQCAVPVDSRINALEMELKLCKQQMMDFEKAYRAEKQRLEEAKEQLTTMKYHPMLDHSLIQNTVDNRKIQTPVVALNNTRKKRKRSSGG